MSTQNAGLAKKLGYTNVKVMLQGVPAWKKSGQMVYAATDYIRNGNNVILDLRTPTEAAAGHIPRAVNIPFENLAASRQAMAIKPSAPIVLYGHAEQPAQAAKVIKQWGFKSIALVEGGFEGWKGAGNAIESGPPATEASWTRVFGENEVSVADFLKVAADGAGNGVVLDVRTHDEAAAGKFASAIHIPLDELAGRMSELPEDKDILVYCTTGARAAMAVSELNRAGYKSRYLLASVECADSDCSVEE